MREQRVDASLVLGIVKQKFCLLILPRHSIVGLDGHSSIRIAVRHHAIANDSVIAYIKKHSGHSDGNEDSFQ